MKRFCERDQNQTPIVEKAAKHAPSIEIGRTSSLWRSTLIPTSTPFRQRLAIKSRTTCCHSVVTIDQTKTMSGDNRNNVLYINLIGMCFQCSTLLDCHSLIYSASCSQPFFSFSCSPQRFGGNQKSCVEETRKGERNTERNGQ